jgi:hypothetical protein
MMQKRKVQRAFTGLVGLPLEEPDAVPIPAAPADPPVDDTLERPRTPAERKRAERARGAIAQVLEDNRDSKGRLHNERSGEAKSKHGMSEMESIVAAQERDEDGKRIRPAGQGPSQFERDETADAADNAPVGSRADLRPSIRNKLDHELEQGAEEKRMTRVAVWAFDGTAFCRMCGFRAYSPDGAVQHIREAYEQGQKLLEHYQTLADPEMSELIPETMVNEARYRLVQDKHYRKIEAQLKLKA